MLRIATGCMFLSALVSFAGCFSPLYLNESGFAGKSALQQEALADALSGALYKFIEGPPKKMEKDGTVTPKVPQRDIRADLKDKKIVLEVAMMSSGVAGPDVSADEGFIRNALTAFLIQEVGAMVVKPGMGSITVLVNVNTFGVDVEAAYFPIKYLPIYSSMTVDAVVKLSLFAYHNDTNYPVYFKMVKDSKQYSRYSVFGFAFK